MRSTKYIFMLFLSMYISACISPAVPLPVGEGENKLKYIALSAVIYLVLMLCDRLLLAVAHINGNSVWMDIYERPLREEKRIYGLDVVRFFAVISVPSIHFMGLTGFYTTPLEGLPMFGAVCARWLFICCVPLFLTLTGYFKHKNGINAAHYKSIFAVLATHIAITCLRLYVDSRYHGIELTREYVTDRLVYFEYGWYVKLYIGIMLLAPFFNLIWSAIKERSHKELLILTLILLCSMGPLTFDIIPSSWVILYVFMYYFIGAYLCEYEIYINKWLNLALLFAAVAITSCGSFLHTGTDGCFNWDFAAYGSNSGYSSLPCVIITFLLVTLLIDADTGFKPIRTAFYSFSVVSLEMYMLSQMFDGIIYPKLNFDSFMDIFPRMPAVVGLIVLLSYIVSHIKRLLFFIISAPLYIFNKKQ